MNSISTTSTSSIDKKNTESQVQKTTKAHKQTKDQTKSKSNSRKQKHHKMFIGGLAKWITENDLKEYFSEFARIKKVKILKDPKTGLSKGFGFIFFKTYSGLETVICHPERHTIKGRVVDCQEALGLAKERDQKKYTEMNKRRVFIGNVSKEINNKDLTEYFSKFGEVKSAYLLKDYKIDENRRYGFVVFKDIPPAIEVTKFREHIIKGNKCFCEAYKTKEETMKTKNQVGDQTKEKNQKSPGIEWTTGNFEKKRRMEDITKFSEQVSQWHELNSFYTTHSVVRLNRDNRKTVEGRIMGLEHRYHRG